MTATRTWWLRAMAAGLAGAVAAATAVLVGETLTVSRRVEMAGDRFLVRPLARGVYDAETSPDGMTYAWTSDVMTLGLSGIDRTARWTVTLRARSAASDPAAAITALVDGVIVARWPADGQLATLTFDLPLATRRGAAVSVTAPPATGGPSDPRVLGLLVDSLTLSRDRRFVLPPPDALITAAVVGFAAGAGLALVDISVLAGTALLIAFVGGYAWLLTVGLTPFAPRYLDLSRSVAAAVLVVGAAARATALRRDRWSPEARAALGAILVATATKALILLHPAVFLGDIGFHLNRLQLVRGGNWLFTSLGPGGEFPYPVALYVAVSALRAVTPDSDLLLRMVVLCADAAAAVLAYAVAGRVWEDRRAALLAATLLVTAKATFHTQVVAFLTNGFGESLATIALLLPAATMVPIGLAVALTASASLAAMLSHTSSAMLLGSSLAAAAVAGAYRASAPMRRAALVAIAALALASAAAYGTYYRHFTHLYGLKAAAPARPAPATVPVPRIEAHQTSWAPGAAALRARAGAVPRYTRRYYGWPAIILAVLGVTFLAGRSDALSRLVLVRLAVCGTFLVIGVTTPLDLRYYLGGASAVALAGGFGAARGLASPNRLLAGGCSALVAWCLIENLRHWFTWFG